jgi:hypothetical protein
MAEDDKNPLNNVERLTDVVAEEIEPNPLEVEVQTVEELPSGQVEMEDGSIMIGDVEGMFDEETEEDNFYSNLAEKIDDQELSRLSDELTQKFKEDKSTREDWAKSYTDGLELLGFNYTEQTRPFKGASGVTHPLLAESVTQFQAQAVKELLPAGGPVRAQVVGAITPEINAQAQRVQDFMNYQLTNVMEDYTPEVDQMLFYLALAGSAFKKIYFDAQMQRAVAKFVPAEDLVVPYGATDLESCERITQIIRMSENDLRKKQITGFYRDVEVFPTSEEQSDIQETYDKIDGVKGMSNDDEMTLFEIHCDLDLIGYEDKGMDGEETGIKLPYIVTIDEGSGKVLSIYRNYEEEDSLKEKKQYFVHYKFLPGLGFYGFGLIHMIGGLSRTATQSLRQLLDAGTLANLPAGFKTRGLRIRDDDQPLQPGEFRDVDSPGGMIREAIMNLPYKEPSQTLFALMGFCVDAGRRFAAIADLQIGEGNQNAAVGTTVALLERGTQVMSAIHKRLHYAQKIEFKLLADVFRDFLPPSYPYKVVGADKEIKTEDFNDDVDIIPVSNPNIHSSAQRIAIAQQELQLATAAPQIHNIREAYRRMYEALGVRDIDNLLIPQQEPLAMDPAMENAQALSLSELKAFPGQDHDAHIKAHLIFGSSPMVLAQPQAATEIQKHILEHISIKAKEIATSELEGYPPNMNEEQLQVQLNARMAQLISQFMAELKEASAQLSGQGGPDPLVQLKQQELQLRAQKDQNDAQVDAQRVALEQERIKRNDQNIQKKINSSEDIAELRARVNVEKSRNR